MQATMTTQQQEALRKALQFSEADLMASIGYFGQHVVFGRPPSMKELEEEGKKWWQTWWEQNCDALRKKICGNAEIKQALGGANDSFEIGVLLFGALAQSYLKDPIIPICAILLKRGIKNICVDVW